MKNVRQKKEATALFKKMKTLYVAFMTEQWHRIMLRFDASSMKLQDKTADLDLGVRLLKSLLEYATSVRENFLDIHSRKR